MKYDRFEHLVLAIGAATILGSLALSIASGARPELVEMLGQLMLVAVLVAAVHFGRREGVVAASVASVIYVALRIAALEGAPLNVTALIIIASRVAAFGLVGIVGGEFCRQIRYSLTRLEGGSALDEWSRVFNQRYLAKQLEQALGRSSRYGEPFTVVLITLAPSLLSELRLSRQRSVIRTLADDLRADIRMVDEVARLDDGRFAIILPHTPKTGGAAVAARLADLVRRSLAARDEAVSVRALSTPEDEAGLRTLLDDLSARTPPDHSAS